MRGSVANVFSHKFWIRNGTEKKDFCELRKKDDGKIVRRAEKSGKLFCNYRRSSGIIFLSNLQKVIEMINIFQNTI